MGAVLVAGLSANAAEVRPFDLGGTNIVLEDVSAEVQVRFRAFRFNEASEQWNVDLILTNSGARQFAPVLAVSFETVLNATGPFQTNGLAGDPPRPFLVMGDEFYSGPLLPGHTSATRTLSFGFVDGAGAPRVTARVFGQSLDAPPFNSALAITRTLNQVGQPLPEVRVTESGPSGPRSRASDAAYGVVTLGDGPGDYVWRFDRSGYLPAWRKATLPLGSVQVIPNPRLVPRDTNAAAITPMGGSVGDATGEVQVNLPPGALSQPAVVTLTSLDGQTLPAILPWGWIPLRAFWFEATTSLSQPALASVKLPGTFVGNEVLVFVRLNEGRVAWEVTRIATNSGAGTVSLPLSRPGAFALVISDQGTLAPPPPQIGQALGRSLTTAPSAGTLSGSGVVTPSTSPASRVAKEVTAVATVTVSSSSGALPSGLVLRGEVHEEYQLLDGSQRFTPPYESFITGYRQPGDTNARIFSAAFPMRPRLLLGGDELAEARVRIDVLPQTPYAGAVFDVPGNSVALDGIRLVSHTGDFAARQAVIVRQLNGTNFLSLVAGTGLEIGLAFDLTVAAVAPGHSLELQQSNLPPSRSFVLARVLSDASYVGLEPVARLASRADGSLTSMEPISGDRLAGLSRAGQYLLVSVPAPQGLIEGFARDAEGQPVAGLPIRVDGQPWLTLSGADGGFGLLAPAGIATVRAGDPLIGREGAAMVTVADVQVPVGASLVAAASGPRVVSVNPTNGAVRVSLVTPMVVTFSKPVNPATLLGGGVQVLGSNGLPVAASATLNLRGTVATLLPTSPLNAGTAYTLVLSNGVTDLTGLPLEGPNRFGFETVKNVARTELAKLTIFEPGATNIPANVRSQLVAYDPVTNRNSVVGWGAPGTAEAEVPVILVNESTGESSTVLSKPDGSFFGFVRADVEDFVSAVFVNANGTRTTVPATEQRFDDGRIGLYRAGGILEAQSDGGPVQVVIDPAVVKSRNTFKLDPLTLVELLATLRGTTPEGAKLLGGFRVSVEGDPPEGSSHVAMPVNVADIPLGPGETPENGAYVLAIAREVEGKTVFQVVDKMRYADGRLKTASPPFDGMLENALRNSPLGTVAGAAVGLTVMSMYMGQGGVTVTGRALDVPEADLQAAAGNLASDIALFIANNSLNQLLLATGARPLQGVFVTLRQAGAPRAFRGGGLPDGLVYSSTDRNGRYAMISPLGFQSAVVSGTHPRYGFAVAEPLLPFFDFSFAGGVFEKDLIFTRPLAVSADTPPRLSAGHTPYFPTPSNGTLLEITASHAAGVPTILQVIDSVYPLLPGVTASPADVRLENIQDTTTGTRIRRRMTVRSDKAVGVVLRLTATANAQGSAAGQLINHVIEFLGEPPQGTNAAVAVDPNDTVGPAVVRTDPPPGGLLTLGEPMVIRFNEPISQSILQTPQYVSLNSANAGVPALRLSPDQHTLSVSFARLDPDQDYTLTIQQAVTDLSGNQLDQRPREPGNQEFTLNFHTSKLALNNLPGMVNGGGVVMNRHFIYALDRGNGGSLRVYSAIDPSRPVPIPAVPLPGPPRDLVFIPSYSFRAGIKNTDPVRTRDLLAVVGGELGSSTVDDLGTVTFSGQYLRVFDVSNPIDPQPLVRVVISRQPDAVTKVRWQPPYLAYLESGQLYQVGFIDLQELVGGFSLTTQERAALPVEGVAGQDKNHDGDYVDDGETVPVPPRNPVEFFGKKFSFTSTEGTTQKLLDFDFTVVQGQLDWLGVTLSDGNRLIPTGLFDPIIGPPVPPGYRTLMFSGVEPDPERATLDFGARAFPKRVVGRLSARLRLNGVDDSRALVLVSLSPDGDGINKLAVVDISLPESPRLLRSIPFPSTLGLGVLQSVTERPDGLLALATTTDTVLLEERLLAEPNPPGGALHPAIVGVIPGTGSGNISLGSNEAELYAVNLGGRSQLIQAAPRLDFVTFIDQGNLVDPSALAGNPALRRQVLTNLAFRARLFPARYRAVGGAVATLTPAAPDLHYHVLVHAPGGPAGHRQILLGLQSLNWAGDAYRNKGLGFPPSQALSASGLNGIGQPLRPDCDAPTAAVKAYRLSDDPLSALYNTYLSEPFALTYERMTIDEVRTLQTENGRPRHVLWSGFGLRALIDPGAASDPAVGAFAAVPDVADQRLRYPAASQVDCFPGAYIVGPNPPPFGGDLAVPGTFGTINAANGELRHTTVDVELPSRLMNLRFVRTAVNQDLVEGPFGPGWDFNYNQHLIELHQEVFPLGSIDPLVVRDTLQRSKRAQPGDVKFVDGAGKVILFRNLGTNAPPEIAADPLVQDPQLNWLGRGGIFFQPDDSEKGVFDLLYKFPGGQFVRLTPTGQQFFYSQFGRLEKIYHPYEKNQHVLHYNERGDLVRIEDRSADPARFIDLGYYRKSGDRMFDGTTDLVTSDNHVNGRIARLIDYAGREVRFEYSPEGVLQRRLGPRLDGVNHGFAGQPTTTYLSGSDCGQILGVTSGNGASGGNNAGSPLFAARSSANNQGLPVATGGNSASGPVNITVPIDNTAANVGGSTTQSQGPDAANGAATEIDFDGNGYPRNVRMTGSGVGNAAVAFQTVFNDFGLLESVTYPEGNSVHYFYSTTDPVFRSRGNLERMEVRPGARAPTAGTPSPLTATFSYDRKYNLPQGAHRDFDNFTATYQLTPDRRSLSRISYSTGEQHEFRSYNAHGQLEEEVTTEGVTRGYRYDVQRGFLTQRIVGGLPTTLVYDDATVAGQLGQITAKILPQNEAIQMEYDARLQMTLWKRGSYEEKRGFDENGNMAYFSRTLDAGQLYEEFRTYSQINFLTQRILKSVEIGNQASDITFNYTPDDAGRVQTMQVLPQGVSRTFQYDHLGNLVGESVGNYTVNYAYDRNNNLTGILPKGTLTREIRYDGYDRPKEIVDLAGSSSETAVLTYFGGGSIRTRKVSSSAAGDVEDYEVKGIDASGRPTGVIYRGDQANADFPNISYTAAGGLTTVVAGPRDATTIVADAAGRLRRVTDSLADVTYHPNANRMNDRIESVEDGTTYSTSYSYNNLDQLTHVGDDLGQLLDFSAVRLDGQPATLADARNKSTVLSYTRLGELKSVLRPLGVLFKFQYDVHRLPQAVLDAEDKGNRYSYDATLRLEKWKLRSGQDLEFKTPDLNNLPKEVTYPGGGGETKEYDNLGRVTREVSVFAGEAYERSGIVYDAFGRVRSLHYGHGASAADSASFVYDLLGPLTSASYREAGQQYTVGYTIDTDRTYKSVTYPSQASAGVTETRQPSGRLASVADAQGPILAYQSFQGVDLPRDVTLGGVILEHNEWDLRRRLLSRRYSVGTSNATVLVDLRYQYDAGFNPLARQSVHRHGRTDVFAYDDASRIDFFEHGARPVVPGAAARAAAGLQGGFGLAKGLFARDYGYGNSSLDLLTRADLLNPDALPRQGAGVGAVAGPMVPAFAATLGAHDASFRLPLVVEGLNRAAPDALGNVTEAPIFFRPSSPGAADAVPADGVLEHNGRADLVRVLRSDGVEIEYSYQASGLMVHRTVRQGNAVASSTHYVWDRERLIEEWDTAGAQKTLRARYYYADTDAPVAADLPDGAGGFARHFYLRDHAESVVALANAQGQVVERVYYDAWGQPVIQARDTTPPAVSLVRLDGGSLLVAFSEAVMPPLVSAAQGLIVSTADPASAFTLTTALGASTATVAYEENLPGFVFGSVFRITPGVPLTGSNILNIAAGAVIDEWGNGNPAITIPLNPAVPSAPILHQGVAQGSTAPGTLARSAKSNPFLFHGQFFDYETGFVYLRARWYDPFTGHFLERDPLQYRDSPNLYAGFGNNPVTYRDPTGLNRSGGRGGRGGRGFGRGGGSEHHPHRGPTSMNSESALPLPVPHPRPRGTVYGGFAGTPIIEEEMTSIVPKSRRSGMHAGHADNVDEDTNPGFRRPLATTEPLGEPEGTIPGARAVHPGEPAAIPDDPFAPTQRGTWPAPQARPEPDVPDAPGANAGAVAHADDLVEPPTPGNIRPAMKPAGPPLHEAGRPQGPGALGAQPATAAPGVPPQAPPKPQQPESLGGNAKPASPDFAKGLKRAQPAAPPEPGDPIKRIDPSTLDEAGQVKVLKPGGTGNNAAGFNPRRHR